MKGNVRTEAVHILFDVRSVVGVLRHGDVVRSLRPGIEPSG